MMRILVFLIACAAHADNSVPVGQPCHVNADCGKGVCEGEGCDAPGKCVDPHRICPHNRVPFCGCDGKTFYQSSACPGRRYRARGACP
jgi:hypothetical protein